MEAKELRIGNYVWENYGGVYLVRGIPDEKNITISKSKTTIAVSFTLNTEVKPIPLTEEWLKKLGFTWAEGLRMNVIKDGITVCEPDDYEDSVYHSIYFYHNGECFGFEVSNEWGENGNVMLPKVKYVHQLQNLYFALTSEELTLK